MASSKPLIPKEQRPLNILLLSSYSQNYASAQEVQAGLDDVLHYRAGANNMYVEYFDSARRPLRASRMASGPHERAPF